MKTHIIKLIIFALIIALSLGGCTAKKEPAAPPQGQQQNTQNNEAQKNNEKAETRTGIYVGRIDSNSVEFELSGLPQSTNARVFQISDDLKDRWDSLTLNEGDNVNIVFIAREQQTPVLIDITANSR